MSDRGMLVQSFRLSITTSSITSGRVSSSYESLHNGFPLGESFLEVMFPLVSICVRAAGELYPNLFSLFDIDCLSANGDSGGEAEVLLNCGGVYFLLAPLGLDFVDIV
jgi:hypothetical protein